MTHAPDPFSFNDKVTLVTGAASGIGRAVALSFARRGAHGVVVSDVDMDGCQETAQQVCQTGANCLALEIDVARPDQVRHMVEETVRRFGQLDCACNNAGVEGEQAPTADCTATVRSRARTPVQAALPIAPRVH